MWLKAKTMGASEEKYFLLNISERASNESKCLKKNPISIV